jgi:hypothetical protein
MKDTLENMLYKKQDGEWTLIAPDGTKFIADSPLKCVKKEMDYRVPATVQIERIIDFINEPEPAFEMNLEFYEGIPADDGWYIVKLIKNHIYGRGNKNIDIDYCQQSKTGVREWLLHYVDNVSHYAKIE